MRLVKQPIILTLEDHATKYPVPLNLSYMWSFGSLSGLALVIQIVTGIFLGMHYTPHVDMAFDSISNIMRNVNHGWWMRYTHANGASFFFIVVYSHILRNLYYKCYYYPHYFTWATGLIIFILMILTSFIGYVLPWGQMSFWAATVITNLLTAIPLIGENLSCWIWGGFSVENPTLNRFASLHYFLPFIICSFVALHITLLHDEGSGNPVGVVGVEYITFYPKFFTKDFFCMVIYLYLLGLVVCFFPKYLGHPDNFIKANPLSTPAHIVPEWYFLPFYAILRSVPNKLGGVLAMGFSIIVFFIIPIFNFCDVRSTRFKPLSKFFFFTFLTDVLLLGWLGSQPVEEPYIKLGLNCSIYYFVYNLIILPVLEFIDFIVFGDFYEKHNPNSPTQEDVLGMTSKKKCT